MTGSVYISIALTLVVGALGGAFLKAVRFPAGYMVGAFLTVAIFGCTIGGTYMPEDSRFVVQVIAGAFVECAMNRATVKSLPRIGKASLVMISSCLVILLVCGIAIAVTSPLDLRTALMCSIPGGMNDIPIVAADMGADPVAVTILQLVRQILGIAIFPLMISALSDKRGSDGEHTKRHGVPARAHTNPSSVVYALLAALVGGALGRLSGIAGMTFAGSIIAAVILKLVLGRGAIPRWLKNCCQMLAGCYIGSLFTMAELSVLASLVLPAVILIVAYTANCFITGWIESKMFGYRREEGMLIATPAGASDMALIIDDMGVRNEDIPILQVIRAVTVMTIFPQLVNLICWLA